jgi:CDP-4-dehydro-6-deoxyglucose reductase
VAVIRYAGKTFDCEGQTVLDCLTAHGVAVPSSCKSGICQSCLMRAVEGKPPAAAQVGLKPTRVAQGYFLACSCRPAEDMTVALPDDAGLRMPAEVISKEILNQDIVSLRLRPSQPMDYRPGQFIRLFRGEAESRCYSLASVPALEDTLEIHVRHVPGGRVSGWVHQDLNEGDSVLIADSSGQCFYVADDLQQPILLLGTGSGLAPLYGIVRDALNQGHRGPIRLYHGSYRPAGLYRMEELKSLAQHYPNFRYVPCISEGDAVPGMAFGTVLDVALAENPDLSGWRIFLCGNPDMVSNARIQTFLAGASMSQIHADPFVPSGGFTSAINAG